MPPLGQEFTAAREARGLSYADVGSQVHIRPALLEAIEAEQWHSVGDVTSLRGLLRTYARFLDLDGGAIVARFNAEVAPRLVAPSRAASGSKRNAMLLRSAAIGTLAVLAVALVVVRVAGQRHFHNTHVAPLVAGDVQTAAPKTSPTPRPSPTGRASATPAASPARSAAPVASIVPTASIAPPATPAAVPSPLATAAPRRADHAPTPAPTVGAVSTAAATSVPTPATRASETPLPLATAGSAGTEPIIPLQGSGG